MFGFDPATCNVYRYDPKKAGDLLDEAGWKMGPAGARKDGQDLTLALYYRSDNPDFAAMATFLQSMYQQIGIKIDLNGLAQAGTSTPCGPASTTSSSGGTPAPIPTWSASSSTRRTPTGDEPQSLQERRDGHPDRRGGGVQRPGEAQALYTQIQMKTLQEAIMVFFADLPNVFAYQKAKVMEMLDWSATNVLLHNAWLDGGHWSRRGVEGADAG